MEVKQAVENRRSIRRWKEKAVEQDKLLKIFELARLVFLLIYVFLIFSFPAFSFYYIPLKIHKVNEGKKIP